jgi:hypothetical protein
MVRKVLVTTRADLFEQRKQEYLRAGCQVENEQPMPFRGMCSFTVVVPSPQEMSSESE